MIRADLAILFGTNPEPTTAVEPPVGALIPGGPAAPELCQIADRWTPDLHPDDAVGDVKLDGRRALYIGGQLVSREGEVMPQAAHSYRALQELERAFGKPMFFDGEYVHPEGLDACARPGGTVFLWDAVPLDQWRRERETSPLVDRRQMLLDRGQHCFGPALGALVPFPLPSKAEAKRKAGELIALGYEGIIVKKRSGLYQRRRSRDWLKVKNWRTVPCRIVDLVPHSVNILRIKGLLVTHEGKVNRITGFDHETQAAIYSQRSQLVGATALIEFTGLTSKGMMRDARFVGIEGSR
jgi:ATP-dependent DNA ligase